MKKNFLVSTEGALRGPLTCDNRPSHPIQQVALKTTFHAMKLLTWYVKHRFFYWFLYCSLLRQNPKIGQKRSTSQKFPESFPCHGY